MSRRKDIQLQKRPTGGTAAFFVATVLLTSCCHIVSGSCRFSSPEWKTARTGPKMSQPNPSDPTRVRLDWIDLVRKPECADAFYVYVWKDLAGRPGSFLQPDRILGPLPTNATSYVVDNIDPCAPFGFLVEMEVRPAMSRAYKVKSGKSNYQTRGIASVVSNNENLVRVEYFYRNQTDDFDLTRAVVKFDKNAIVKNPDCLSNIELEIKEMPPSYNVRYKRTIGKLYESPPSSSSSRTNSSTSTYSSSYTSSTTYSSSGGRYGSRGSSSRTTSSSFNNYALSTSSQKFSPPFVSGRGNTIELSFRVKPCTEYTIAMMMKGQRGTQVGRVDNIRLKSLDQVPNFRLPPITDVLSTTPLGLSRNSPIPATCLDTYFRAVNRKLASNNCNNGGPNAPATPRPNFSSSSTVAPAVVVHNPILKQHGCLCSNTSMINFTSTDSKVLSKHKLTLGAYKFSGKMHQGRPYYVKGSGNEELFVYWSPQDRTWFISEFLGSISPVIRMGKNADTKCPENPPLKKTKWQRKGIFGSWSNDNSARMSCDATAKKVVPSEVIGQCRCRSGVVLNATITAPTRLVNEVVGIYRFESKLHAGKPYYVKRKQGVAHYIFFAKGTWHLAKQLGSTSPVMKMEKNAPGNCPESSMKKWQVKNVIGMWKKDNSFSLTCAEGRAADLTTPRPSYYFTTTVPATRAPFYRTTTSRRRPSYGTTTTPTPRPAYGTPTTPQHRPANSLAQLKTAGCKCHTTPVLTVTSTDSRTKSKHGDQLGEYRFMEQLHNSRPVYSNSRGNYMMYFNSGSRAWEVAAKADFDKAAGGKVKTPTMRTQDGTDQTCPGDPVTSQSKPWTRKNMWGIWGRDKTLVVKCGAGTLG